MLNVSQIETVLEGEMVKSYDIETHQPVDCKVLSLFSKSCKCLSGKWRVRTVVLKFSDGTAIENTWEHRYYVVNKKAWCNYCGGSEEDEV